MAQVLEAVFRVTDGTTTVDLLGPGSGWRLADPGWRPQIAQLKGGGSYADSALAEGRTLMHGEYRNVVETIPLTAYGHDQDKAIKTIRELMQLLRQAADYWKESYEYNDVWLEVRPACNDCLTGYSRVMQGRIAELSDPFRQPFFGTAWPLATMEDLVLVVEREPFWRGVEPGTIVGPLYNLLRNPDLELWTQSPGAETDVEPDNWSDIETLWITGTNNRQGSAVHSGSYALRVNVSGSTLAGASKGVTQVVEDTRDDTEYTMLAWVRSEGVSNGVGRVLVTYSDQLELYRSAERHGWTLYAATFTTGIGDVVAVHCEILTTAANTDGTVYFDSLMLLEGDWVTEANNGTLPYLSSSHIVNHWDQLSGVVDAGDIDWVDVWDVPGDVDALIRMEFQNNSEPADYSDPVEVYRVVRIGQRRTRDVTNFDNYHDPPGPALASGSSGDRIRITPSADWVDVTTKTILGGNNTDDNMGRFRVLARVYDKSGNDPSTLWVRLGYWIGLAGIDVKTLSEIPAPTQDIWCILDLTESVAMVQDLKFSPDPPGALGYLVQFQRKVGEEDEAWFDYSLVMPTDGGYLEAEIEPALTYRNILIADSTASRSVEATFHRAGWTIAYDAGTAIATGWYGMVEFRGAAFFGIGVEVFRHYRGVWSTVLTEAANHDIHSLEVYEGEIYAATLDPVGGNAPVRRSSDGVTWSTAFSTGDRDIYALKSFDGRLFVATFNGVVGRIHTWDGSALTASLNPVPGGLGVYPICFEVYNNQLYAGLTSAVGTGAVYRYDPGTDAWNLAFSATGAMGVRKMRAFLGRLIVATGNAGRIYQYDGSTLTLVHDSSVISAYQALEVYNRRIYAGGDNIAGGGFAAPVLGSDDGLTWSTVYDPLNQIVDGLLSSGGVLYMGTNTKPTNALIYTFVESDVQYKVSNFEGGVFTAPSRGLPSNPRRHRWVFSYDREDFINNIDDKALVGIGFVPRYLSLRGAG